jgi:ABC-2 type transport system ATP-binding protein
VHPDSGDVDVDGRTLDLAAIRRTIFLMPDGITPWAEHPVHEIVRFWRRVHGRSGADAHRRIEEVGLAVLLGRRVQELSKGERKRFLIALALLASQPVLMLDEPLDGLDLRQMREVAPLLRAEARGGRTVIVSMHQLADAARMCDRLALLHDGRIVAEGTLGELRATAGRPDASLEEVFLALT